MVYKEELAEWGKSKDMKCLLTVDTADKDWKGDVGVVGSLFKKITLDAPNTAAIVCGPPIMIKFVVQDLFKLGFKEENIITTLERYMKCGIGKCGHCAIGHKYVCIDGPVFNFKQIKSLPEKV
jgi:NAD(P)H-flavin reductase